MDDLGYSVSYFRTESIATFLRKNSYELHRHRSIRPVLLCKEHRWVTTWCTQYLPYLITTPTITRVLIFACYKFHVRHFACGLAVRFHLYVRVTLCKFKVLCWAPIKLRTWDIPEQRIIIIIARKICKIKFLKIKLNKKKNWYQLGK